MSTGMLKVGYNELLEILSTVRNSTDSKAPILLNELTELSKQARFQPWVDFKYDVVNTINKLYPNYVSSCKEDSLPYVLHFMFSTLCAVYNTHNICQRLECSHIFPYKCGYYTILHCINSKC